MASRPDQKKNCSLESCSPGMAGGYAIPEVGEEAGWPDFGFMALIYQALVLLEE